MSALKDRLSTDLTTAMKARDQLTTGTLRMVLSAVKTAEVAGKSARELTDDEVVLAVLTAEAKKRREAAEIFDTRDRAELADQERRETTIIERYLPQQLTDEELTELVTAAITETGAAGPKAMGQVMKVVQPQVIGRADGGRVSAEVRRQLAS
ncbi:GatB/YqeY domain-containing protein [Fodinicola feengrottensis]|uniref:GatB/YqeY domain-containing protein n=1 Tax=Fodinicola feengrottensis TaxID=435914 RepID=UPI0013D6B2BC|nr:GatB/YqeY domain-containing protein [Fodinicola feengrottensis]